MQLHPYRRVALLAAGTLVLGGLGVAGATAGVPSSDSVIAGSAGWYSQAYENFDTGGYLTPAQADAQGPQRAPYGTSSHRLTVGESSAQTELYRTDAYDGVAVADLTRLEYSELVRSTAVGNPARQPAYLRLSVDTDDDGKTDDSLFFYPANNGPVVNGQWQNWDVGGGTIDVNGDAGGTTTLALYAAGHPGATLVNDKFDVSHDAGALALIAGGGLHGADDSQINAEYFLDRVIVGDDGQDTLFDLGGSAESNGGRTDVTVDPSQAHGWKFQAYNANYEASDQAFVDGPATPPLGGGSVRATITSADPDRVELFRTEQYDGTLLRDLRDASYSTYVAADAGNATPQQPAYMRLSLDNDGDGTTDQTLFYFPANNGPVLQHAWQTWDAAAGLWSIDADGGAAAAVTLDDYLVAHPDSTIVVNADVTAPAQPQGGVAFVVGDGGANQLNGSYYLDNLTIGRVNAATGSVRTSTRFDLEPTLPTVSVGDTSVSEGNSGATLHFPVTLSRPFAVDTTVEYATSNGTAQAGSDYQATSGTVTIPAGSVSANVSVTVFSDKVREADEGVRLNLSAPVEATVADGVGVGTIVNDDTKVGIALHRATQHRIRVLLSTGPVASGAPVAVYRVRASGRHQLLSTTLTPGGHLSVRLARHFRPGTRVTLVAVVRTANGAYSSRQAVIRIRR